MIVAGLGISSCNSSAPARPPQQGQAVRAEIDRLTRAYGACVDAKANAQPVAGELAGTMALRLQGECASARAPLITKTAEFYRIGHPKAMPALAKAVAEASVEQLEDEIRSNAVIAIVQRQNQTKAN